MNVAFKCRVIAAMEINRLPPGSDHEFLWGSITEVAKQFGVKKWDVTRWMKSSSTLIKLVVTKKNKDTKLGVSKVKFPEQERMLFNALYIRRQLLGLWVDRYWLQAEFAVILRLTKPEGYLDFKFSNGWVSSFCTRWKITQQVRTNKKDVPIGVKAADLKIMHTQMFELQKSVLNDPIYGRFSPLHMFHADQSPCEFAMPGTSTLNIQGTPCWMWQPGSGLDKRFIPIHLCIRAGGKQIIKPIIIFRGQGLLITQAEQDQLNALQNVRWYFQPKAWADTEFCLWSLASFKSDLAAAGIHEEVLLGLDGLQAQHNQLFLNAAGAANVLPFYTPPDCTDVVAPCDHHVFVRLKKLIKKFYRLESEVNRNLWA